MTKKPNSPKKAKKLPSKRLEELADDDYVDRASRANVDGEARDGSEIRTLAESEEDERRRV